MKRARTKMRVPKAFVADQNAVNGLELEMSLHLNRKGRCVSSWNDAAMFLLPMFTYRISTSKSFVTGFALVSLFHVLRGSGWVMVHWIRNCLVLIRSRAFDKAKE